MPSAHRRQSSAVRSRVNGRRNNKGASSDPFELSPLTGDDMNTKPSLWHSCIEEPSLATGRYLVMLASALYGTNFAIVKLIDQTMPILLSAAIRFSIAAAVVTLSVLYHERLDKDGDLEKERWWGMLRGAEVGFWYCIGYIAQAEALQSVDASYSAFFNALSVIVVPILDVFFRGRKLDARTIGSVSLAIAGVALLQLGPSLFQAAIIVQDTTGNILCWVQAIVFGVGYWRLEAASTDFPDQDARITVGLVCSVAAGSLLFAMLPISSVRKGDTDLFASLQLWLSDPFILGSLLWTGLISTALALYLETVALKVVSASELTILMTSVSLWGSAFAYVTMGEILSPIGWIGGLMILAACVLNGQPNPGKELEDGPSSTASLMELTAPLTNNEAEPTDANSANYPV